MNSVPTAGEQGSERQAFWCLLLCCAVLLGVMAWPAVQGKIYVKDDLWAAHYPMRQFYANCLRTGESFIWMPAAFCGYYLAAWGEVGTFHPLKWLLYRIIEWPAAFNIDLLWSYLFMLPGMYFFLRRHLKRRDACLFGAMTFAFSGFSLLHFVHPTAMSVISHYPWLFLALNVTATGQTLKSRVLGEAGIAVLTASQLLLGYPQYVWIGLLGQAFYVAHLIGSGALKISSLGKIVVPCLIGLAIGCAQVLPTWDALADSTRTASDPDFALTGSMHPLNLVQLVAPWLFESRVVGQNTHEFGMHFGAIPLILVIWLMVTLRSTSKSERSLTLAFAIMSGVSLLLMFGKYGGLYYLQTWLPVIGSFRFPARYGALLHFGVAVLSAIAYSRLASDPQSVNRRQLALIGICLAVSGVAFTLMFSMSLDSELLASWPIRIAGAISLAVAAMVFWIRGPRLWPVLIVLTATSLGVYGISYFLPQVTTEPQALSEIPRPPQNTGKRVLIENQFFEPGIDLYYGNELMAAGYQQADGYLGLMPRVDLLGPNTTLESLRIAGVGWVMNRGQNASIGGLQPESELWLHVNDALPRVRLVGNSQQSTSVVGDLPKIDPTQTALVDRPLEIAASRIGKIQQVVDRPGNITVVVDVPETQLLVVAERYHPGSKVSVDGQPSEAIRVYQDFLGCVVQAGDSQVCFSFQPASLRIGSIACFSGLLGLVIWVVLRARYGQRLKSNSELQA